MLANLLKAGALRNGALRLRVAGRTARRLAAAKEGRAVRAKAEMPLQGSKGTEKKLASASIGLNWGINGSRTGRVGGNSPLEHLDDD